VTLHAPKDLPSYLFPFDEECTKLAYGVWTFNTAMGSHFPMHAYHLFTLRDMVSINAELGIKGHNGFSPCRSCEMKGIWNVTDSKSNYYIPLTLPAVESKPLRSWDPTNLPLHTHDSFSAACDAIRNTWTQQVITDLEMYHGISGEPTLHRVSSVNLAQCYPWDWMHLFLKNIIPSLIKLWIGKYKGLDVGIEDYKIDEEVWNKIGRKTAEAVKDVPAAFM
jgi:hypothetical protein